MKFFKRLLPSFLRRWLILQYLQARFDVKVGRAVTISRDTVFEGMNVVMDECKISSSVIGRGTYIAPGSVLSRARVGRFCSVGSRVKVSLGHHPTSQFVSAHPAFFSLKEQAGFTFVDRQLFEEHTFVDGGRFTVEIGNDVWIGDNAVIMDGVRIGNGAIIGTGAVVTRSIAPYSINVGVPTRLLRFRFDQDTIGLLQEFQWWSRDVMWIRANWRLFADIDRFVEAVTTGKWFEAEN